MIDISSGIYDNSILVLRIKNDDVLVPTRVCIPPRLYIAIRVVGVIQLVTFLRPRPWIDIDEVVDGSDRLRVVVVVTMDDDGVCNDPRVCVEEEDPVGAKKDPS